MTTHAPVYAAGHEVCRGGKAIHAFENGETVLDMTRLGQRLFVATSVRVYELDGERLVPVRLTDG